MTQACVQTEVLTTNHLFSLLLPQYPAHLLSLHISRLQRSIWNRPDSLHSFPSPLCVEGTRVIFWLNKLISLRTDYKAGPFRTNKIFFRSIPTCYNEPVFKRKKIKSIFWLICFLNWKETLTPRKILLFEKIATMGHR